MKEIERKLEYRVNSFINIPRLIEYHLVTRLATRNSRVNNPRTRESTKKRCWIAKFAKFSLIANKRLIDSRAFYIYQRQVVMQ